MTSAQSAAARGQEPARRVPDAARHAASRSTTSRFDIAPGEVLGVVGESGAGKSLTGTAIIGLLEPPGPHRRRRDPARGRAHRQPAARGDAQHPRRRIGAIFQDPLTSLNPLYTVGQQLVETIRTHLPMSARRRRAQRALALLSEVGIPAPEQRIDHYPHQFSGGMRQRVVIALALCAEPAPGHRRRADHRARRLDPGADHRAAEAALPRARHRGDADHARHGRDRRDRRPRRGDVCRPHRRDRPGARGGQARRSIPTPRA